MTEKQKRKYKHKITPMKTIIIGYLVIIFIGTLLLMLPVSSRMHSWTPLEDALFTSTSATCVTGLVMHDTFTYWSLFGQIVILCMIQIGGIGFMTIAVSALTFTKLKIGLRNRYTLQESVNAPQMGGIVRMTRFILCGTAVFECAGAVLLAFRFCPRFGFWKGLYFSVFHSISAFCNAGFDLMGEEGAFSSLTAFADDVTVNLVISVLIIIGGLGFFVWSDLVHTKFRFSKFKLHTKTVLTATAALILISFVLLLIFDANGPVFSEKSYGETLLATLFQAITPRTAGFNTVDLAQLSDSSILLMIGLMLIGGSPGSTAGGFKTTTFAILCTSVISVIRRKKEVELFNRRIARDVLIHISCLVSLYIILFMSSSMLISALDEVSLKAAMFEAASAIGTVGLSLSVTPTLSGYSHLILICLMYFGRVGGLTLLLSLGESKRVNPSQLPVEQIAIG